ncbi:MAG: DUF2294 family protein [Actinobacteria bacterium]|nr:DUF2294 family protein [Actinomycetota bacterium]
MTGDESDSSNDIRGEISETISHLYGKFYGHERSSVRTFINENVVLCIVDDTFSRSESDMAASGGRQEVLDNRAAFQVKSEDEFTREVERITDRKVTAFMSANQTDPGVSVELFILDEAPGARDTER